MKTKVSLYDKVHFHLKYKELLNFVHGIYMIQLTA